MKILKNFKRKIKKVFTYIRNIFIKEKEKYITSKVFDNVNLNFKNLSPYSELNVYKIVFLLLFLSAFLIIIAYFSYIDFKYNIQKNSLVENIEPLEIVIKNPINTDLPQDYENIIYNVKKGDMLLNILVDTIKISQKDAYNCINELKKIYNISNIQTNQKLYIKYKNNINNSNDKISNSIILDELKIIDENNLKEIVIFRTDNDSYSSNVDKIELFTYYDKYIIKISNNMYTDAVEAGMPAEIVMNLINYYSFDIDFQRDLKKDDWFEVVFEAFYTKTGKKIKNGKIIYANLHNNNKDHKIYKFEYNNNIAYFDENGLSTQKSLLKTPINGARISSGYSKGRKHPVLGYTRAHKGIDFAAPIGTPFYAAGNGIVKKIITGCRVGDRYCGGGFGNYISIKHNSIYTTEYGHISRIGKNIRAGSKVKQGQVIAYVGTTGLSTGPHLHYGIIYKGERINPARIKTTSTIKLTGKNLLNFIDERDKINTLRLTAINQNITSM